MAMKGGQRYCKGPLYKMTNEAHFPLVIKGVIRQWLFKEKILAKKMSSHLSKALSAVLSSFTVYCFLLAGLVFT